MNISVYRTVAMLAPLAVGLPFAMDIYVPALPHIASVFHVSASQTQLTLTVFMLTAGFMQLFIGPLSDQFGRKKIIYLNIILFSIGAVLCASANNISQLVIFRVIQAIGACGMLVIALAIVRDLYEGNKSAKTYSYINGIIAFSPIFAPFIGSYLDVHFDWGSTFLALLVISIAGFFTISIGLPETLPKKKRIKLSLRLLTNYKLIASNKIFIVYSFFSATGLSYLYLFCSISPYIIIRKLHVPEIYYGYYFCFMGISVFIGSILAGTIVEKIGIYKTMVFGFLITLLGGIIMTTWYLVFGLSINNFIWPMLLIGTGGTFVLGAGNGGAMQPFTESIGAASALGGSLRFLFAGFIGSLLITEKLSSTLPLSLPAIVFSLFGLIIFLFYRKNLIFTFATKQCPIEPQVK